MVYNSITMKNTPSNKITQVDRDPRLFMWILTFVVSAMYVVTLRNVPAVLETRTLVFFTVLTITHILLHWQLEKISTNETWALWYIVIQGAIALAMSLIGSNIGIILALFMGLLGEAVGLFGLTRRGVLATVFYLILLAISLVQLSGWVSSGAMILSTLPMTIFVIIYVTLYMRQTDAREQAEKLAKELEDANHQLSEYAAQVEDLTIANERQRMARELHDTLSQGLAGIILQLEATEAHLDNQRIEKAQTIVTNAMTQARATLADSRNAIDDLRQSSLDDLDAELRLEISRFTDATGIPCNYHADRTPSLLDSVKEAIIRAVGEALTNVARHALASEVVVNLSLADDRLLVSVQDDGQGFDLQTIPTGHYGILGIRERVRLINGTVNIQSEAGKGTKLEVSIPL